MTTTAPLLRAKTVDTRTVAFWTMVALSAAGLWLLLKDLLPWARVFGPSALFGVVFLAFSLALGLWLVRRLLRPVQAPPRPGTWLAVMWGGLAACGIAQLLNGVLLSAWSRALDLETAASWAPALTAPINEELAKAAGVVMLTAVSASLVRGAADGFVLGALVGLGFQVSENLSYGFLQILAFGGVDPLAATQQAAMVRFLLTGIGSHWAMTAVAGAGIGYLAGAVGRPPAGRIAAFIGCLLLAMGMHWAFDAPVLDGFLDPVGKPLLNFLIALVVYLSVRRRFRARWQAVADEEVAAGTMGADEAAALSRRRSRARARRRVPAGPQRETAARVQRAQLDLVEARVPGDLAVEDAQPLREAVADARRGDPARR